MTRTLLSLAIATALIGCTPPVEGKLVNGMTGEPISGAVAEGDSEKGALRVFAKAVVEKDGKLEPNPGAGLTCQTIGADVGADGSFKLEGACTGETAYRFELTDTNWFLGETDMIPAGHAGPVTIKAWRAPNGAGVFVLDGMNLDRVSSAVELEEFTVLNAERKVLGPKGTIPGNIPLVDGGKKLLLTGAANADLKLAPLVNSPPRQFGSDQNGDTPTKMSAWAYVGVAFSSDTEVSDRNVTTDDTKVTTVEKRGHVAKFISADAVPPGRYVLTKEGLKRKFIVDFGAKGQFPNEEFPPEAEGEGEAAE